MTMPLSSPSASARPVAPTRILLADDHALVHRGVRLILDGEELPARAITGREEEILKLVAEGHPSEEIAELLVISVKTVERHRANLLQKLGLRDRLELTRYAIRADLIGP
ncbi:MULTISPECIES: helix-turn-helix transcriptional regulator [unclassified Streptomyces]|uniref:response regulator transcription factor n=1 Tax=unclassified Streptomyces TaxID=2593676 RepID=UPI000FDC4679|nr:MULTISPECIES: helix-turn-helix transcriptional regulator [unclassified Streptomyces]UQA38328.1 helix-turn-helix transcriptional regulator [Streptomyces sp. HNA39]